MDDSNTGATATATAVCTGVIIEFEGASRDRSCFLVTPRAGTGAGADTGFKGSIDADTVDDAGTIDGRAFNDWFQDIDSISIGFCTTEACVVVGVIGRRISF